MRPATSLNGDWATIIDPYSSGFSNYYRNQITMPGDNKLVEYNFAKSPKLRVPGDLNTQRESLFYYEGPVWYQSDFTYHPKQYTRIFLRTGRANSYKDAETLLGWGKELGANYVRLVHYLHDETTLRAADRMGLLVWSENPVHWAIQFDNPKVLAKAKQQLEEEIGTSRNHAAITFWSMANETPNHETRTRFIETLAQHACELNPTRLITAALLVYNEGNTKVLDDPLGKALDVIRANEYVGWYEQTPAGADTTQWRINYDKPVIVSEFGGGAKPGFHGPATQR